jgi:multiple sugar transport system ATP-binding protein
MTANHVAGLAGNVVLVEHVGAESIVSIRLDHAKTAHGDDGIAGDEVMVVEQGYSDLRAGQAVRVGLDLAEAVLFSRDGQRLAAPATATMSARAA